jgi:hypothetical protein
MMQMQAYAACGEDDVRDTVRRCYEHLYREVRHLAGSSPDAARQFFSTGMFLNVMSAMDAPTATAPWMDELMGELLLDKLR